LDEYANYNVGCLYTGPMPEQLTENIHAIETTWRWMAGLQLATFEDNLELLCEKSCKYTRPLNYKNESIPLLPFHCRPLSYDPEAPPIHVVTDGHSTGIAGIISQGHDWKIADVAVFYSAKLNPAQRNYSVHEIEMLAGVETILQHHDILEDVNFQWYIDHKGLIHLLE